MSNLNISLLQTFLHWEDPAANRSKLAELIVAELPRADLIVLPETFTTGFTMAAGQLAENAGGESCTWLRQLATTHGVHLCGSMVIEDEGQFFNRLVWATPEGMLHFYDKRHLFRMVGERDVFTPGSSRLVVQVGEWRVCTMICYDLRFPVWSRNRNDYDLLLYVANWPASRKSAWETLLPARAVENLCFAAGVNRTGRDGNGVQYDGGSMIVDYLGHKIALAGTEPEILRATLDLAKLRKFREKFPAWKDADDFDLIATRQHT